MRLVSLVRSFAALTLLCASTVAPALAQDRALSLELNNARDGDKGCRLTYIALNGTGTALDKTSYQIVVFDAEDKVAQFLILEFGALPAGKTKVVEFDFPNRPCNQISRILVNDVSECVAGGKPSTVCMDNLRTASKNAIGFGI